MTSAALALALLSACADAFVYDEDIALLGLERHEHCTLMWEGQDIHVAFETSDEVSFDVHHHQGEGREPEEGELMVGPELVKGEAAFSFPVTTTGEVCLQWHNQRLHAQRLRFTLSYSTPALGPR